MPFWARQARASKGRNETWSKLVAMPVLLSGTGFAGSTNQNPKLWKSVVQCFLVRGEWDSKGNVGFRVGPPGATHTIVDDVAIRLLRGRLDREFGVAFRPVG